MMDRDGSVYIRDQTVSTECPCFTSRLNTPKTLVQHPESADEALKQGHRHMAPYGLNGTADKCMLVRSMCCVVMPVLPTLYWFFCPFPNLHYQLQEVGTGRIVDGMRYTHKSGTSPPCGSEFGKFDKQAGDVIEFTEHAPLRLRKDMLAAVVYRLAATTFEPPKPDDDSGDAHRHESN